MNYSREELYQRQIPLLGQEGLEKLAAARIAICGLGGVGSYAAEALARCGAGSILLIDHDRVSASNINRQLCALHSTVNRYKTEVIAERIADIDPACKVDIASSFIDEKTDFDELLEAVTYVVDAIDHLPGKTALICWCITKGIPVISAMGAGRRLDPQKLQIADISRTSGCPLARNLRRELRSRGINSGVKAVFSTEQPLPAAPGELGSISFVPSVAGLLMASAVVRDITGR